MRTAFLTLATLVLTYAAHADDKPAPDMTLARFAGNWKVVSTSGHGKVVKAAESTAHGGGPLWADTVFRITGDQLTTIQEPVVLVPAKPEVGLFFAIYTQDVQYKLKVLETKDKGPAKIDLLGGDAALKGIYEFQRNQLKLCVVNWMACKHEGSKIDPKSAESKTRPPDFTTKEGGEHVSFVLERAAK